MSEMSRVRRYGEEELSATDLPAGGGGGEGCLLVERQAPVATPMQGLIQRFFSFLSRILASNQRARSRLAAEQARSPTLD
jgi:hypothetical protein